MVETHTLPFNDTLTLYYKRKKNTRIFLPFSVFLFAFHKGKEYAKFQNCLTEGKSLYIMEWCEEKIRKRGLL